MPNRSAARYPLTVDPALVIGYGNPLRRDDGVGPVVVRGLELCRGRHGIGGDPAPAGAHRGRGAGRSGRSRRCRGGSRTRRGALPARGSPVDLRNGRRPPRAVSRIPGRSGARSLRPLPGSLVGHRRGGRSGLRRGAVAGGRGGGRSGACGRGGACSTTADPRSRRVRDPAPDGRSRLPRHPRDAPPTASGRPRGSSTTGTDRRPG